MKAELCLKTASDRCSGHHRSPGPQPAHRERDQDPRIGPLTTRRTTRAARCLKPEPLCLSYTHGADPRVLQAAGAEHAGVIVSTMRRVEDSVRLIQRCPDGHTIVVRVFSEGEADKIRAAGGIPIVFVKGATDTLMDWFDREVRGARASS